MPNSLQWHHNGRDSVSNHQPHDCFLNHLFRCTSKKTSKLRVTGLCAGNSPRTGELPTQMASNAENVPIWWRHHACIIWVICNNRDLHRLWLTNYIYSLIWDVIYYPCCNSNGLFKLLLKLGNVWVIRSHSLYEWDILYIPKRNSHLANLSWEKRPHVRRI